MSKGYLIKTSVVESTLDSLDKITVKYRNYLSELTKTIDNFDSSRCIEGKTAEAMMAVMEGVCLPTVQSLYNEFRQNMLNLAGYYSSLKDIDNSDRGYFDSETLENVISGCRKMSSDFTLDVANPIRGELSSISDIIALSAPREDVITDSLDSMRKIATKLNNDLIDLETVMARKTQYGAVKELNGKLRTNLSKGALEGYGLLLTQELTIEFNKSLVEAISAAIIYLEPFMTNHAINTVKCNIYAIQILYHFITGGITGAQNELYHIIPKLSNWDIIYVEEIMRQFSILSNNINSSYIGENFKHNYSYVIVHKAALFSSTGYIENQSDDEWSYVKFGNSKISNMSYSGCEIIAAYNALVSLGADIHPSDLASMITYFEKQGPLLKGEFGSSPAADYQFFKDKGYKVNMIIANTDDAIDKYSIDSFGEKYDTYVVTAYNDKSSVSNEIHTVNISVTTDKAGKRTYYIHNARIPYAVSDGYLSLSDAIKNIDPSGNQKGKSISVIGVKSK